MSRKRVKQYLMLLCVIGLVGVAAGSGTFASFNAEVTNPGNYFATGSLFLHNTHGATTCTSESSNTNVNPGTGVGGDQCATLFTVAVADSHAHYAQLTLNNAGTVDADGIKFKLASACQNARVYQTNTQLTVDANATDTALTVSPTTLAIQAGGHIEVTDGTNTEELTVTTAVPLGATSITLSSPLANSYLAATPTAVNSSADFGASSLCSHLDFTVTETLAGFPTTTQDDTGTTGAQGCAYGTAAGGGDGCVFDSAHNLAAAGLTSLAPLTLKTGINSNAAIGLDASRSRYFLLGLKADPTAITNADQDTKAKFDLVWHLDQA